MLHGLSFKGNVSKVKLIEMINEASKTQTEEVGVEDLEEPIEDPVYEDEFHTTTNRKPTRAEIKELKYQALLMLKVKITNLNPEESDANTVYAGVVTPYVKAARYIPFDRPWYVEQCLVDKLMTDKVQAFVNEIDPNTGRPTGNKKPKLVKHYNIEFLR
jgi:hypothetical protein